MGKILTALNVCRHFMSSSSSVIVSLCKVFEMLGANSEEWIENSVSKIIANLQLMVNNF